MEQQNGFGTIKMALVTTPNLAIVDITKPFVIEINASDREIGAILWQDKKPTTFESKKLDKA